MIIIIIIIVNGTIYRIIFFFFKLLFIELLWNVCMSLRPCDHMWNSNRHRLNSSNEREKTTTKKMWRTQKISTGWMFWLFCFWWKCNTFVVLMFFVLISFFLFFFFFFGSLLITPLTSFHPTIYVVCNLHCHLQIAKLIKTLNYNLKKSYR